MGEREREGELVGRGELGVSTESRTQWAKAGDLWDHRDCKGGGHQVPGERERIAFHVHQFDHGCYGDHCLESGRLYKIWQAALATSGNGLGT